MAHLGSHGRQFWRQLIGAVPPRKARNSSVSGVGGDTAQENHVETLLAQHRAKGARRPARPAPAAAEPTTAAPEANTAAPPAAGPTRGLSQEALAHECGMGRTYLSGVERSERNVSIDNIARIAKGLHIEQWKLLRDD